MIENPAIAIARQMIESAEQRQRERDKAGLQADHSLPRGAVDADHDESNRIEVLFVDGGVRFDPHDEDDEGGIDATA